MFFLNYWKPVQWARESFATQVNKIYLGWVLSVFCQRTTCRIKDKFSLVFAKFLQIALVAARLGKFCENFENTRENLSLILLSLMRLHILISRNPITLVIWYSSA